MTAGKPGLGDLAVQVACAFAEAFFAEDAGGGQQRVPLEQAHIFASGRLDLWDSWSGLDADVKALVGRFLRIRHNELAALHRFLDAARRLFASTEAPFVIPPDVPQHRALHVQPMHGQPPLIFARRTIERMEDEHARRRTPTPVAGRDRWEFGWQDRSQIRLPNDLNAQAVPPVRVSTAASVGEITVTRGELIKVAAELDQAWGGLSWRASVVAGLLDGLHDEEGVPVQQLVLTAGRLGLLNAPTGVGKSVLMRTMAIVLARADVTVALVASNIDEARSIRDAVSADIGMLEWERGRPSCTLLLSPRRMKEKALVAAELDDWEHVDALGYGCALSVYVVDGPLPQAGEEPCNSLRLVTPGEPGNGSDDRSAGRHCCPWRAVCERHRPARDAAEADIIVTYHHYLAGGQVPVPISVDGLELDRISVLELVMRRCPVVIIDEIDQFQSVLVETSSQEVVLAAKGHNGDDLPLSKIEMDRGRIPARADRQVLPPLLRTRFLSEQFLNYLVEEELWLEEDVERPGSGWHLPGGNDRMLLESLFDLPAEMEVPPSIYGRFNALFPDRDEPEPVELNDDLREVQGLLAESVSNDDGADRVPEYKHRLHSALIQRVTDRDERIRVVNALLVRAWLGSLRQALTRLTFAVTTPEAHLPAARQLADKLGMFVQHSAIPYGPLGYMLFGFRVQFSEGPTRRGQLSTQAIAGDPHTTTAQLGGVVALAAAGCERIVVGMSATAYFPGAAREHIHSPVTWAMTDADPDAVTAAEGSVLGEGFKPIQVGGQPEAAKDGILTDLGARLWDQYLESELAALQIDDPDRAHVMVVTNSYRQAALLAHGMTKFTDPGRLAVAVSATPANRVMLPPHGSLSLTAEQFETFPHYRGVSVLLAPISRVARALNILIPGQQRSAISSIWVCVRPIAQLLEPAEMFASINAHAVAAAVPSADPASTLAAQRRTAHRRLYRLLGSDPRFSLLPRDLKAEVVAGMLVDFIQLAGRARRGGTAVELYLVDNAFHDSRLGSDLPSLLRFHYDNLPPTRQAEMRRIYGSTLTSLLAYAGLTVEENRT